MQTTDEQSQFRIEQAQGIFEDLVVYLRENVNRCEDPQARRMFESATEIITGLTEVFESYTPSSKQSA